MQYRNFFLIFLLVVLFSVPGFFSYGQSASELKNKIDEKGVEIEKLEAQIKIFQGELNALSKEKASLNGSIKQLDLTKKKLNADITVTQDKIDQTNLKIQGLSSQINTKEDSINNAMDAIALDIKKTNELEETSLIENILSENDFSVIWNDIDNMMTLHEAIKENIVKLKEVKVDLEDTREVSIKAKNELTMLRSKLADQKKIVEQNVKEKNTLLAQTKNSEANYQKLVASQLAKKVAFEKELQDYESQLKFILNPSELPGSGVLGWPLDQIYVTQMFGKTADSKRLYASGSHSGADFRASVGTPVKAMADGVVMGAGNTDDTCPRTSFGKWILIKYNNGLASAYGHLSLIKVSSGMQVKRGDIVGYSGNTGHTTGPHLHVTVYVGSAVSVQKRPSTTCEGRTYTMPLAPTAAYLDPLYYLPKLPY